MLASSSLAVRFANAVMARWPDPQNITMTPAWEYNHGIVLRGIEQVYRHTGDARYLTYIRRYADEFINASGQFLNAGGMSTLPTDHSFDNIQPSVLLPFLFQQTSAAKYHTAADTIRARYDTIPRNPDGGFWHKQIYPNEMWLDGVYMGLPFLMRYATTFGTCGTFCADTVVAQALLVANHVRDPATGLLYHAWDDSAAGAKAAWADPTTGRSPSVWGRAMGWYAMALVDMLPDIPADHAGRSDLLTILTGMASAIRATQDTTTGLWFQVVDQGAQHRRLDRNLRLGDVRLCTEGRRRPRLPRSVVHDRRDSRLAGTAGQGDHRHGRRAHHHGRCPGHGRSGQLRRLHQPAADAVQLAARPVRDPARCERDGSDALTGADVVWLCWWLDQSVPGDRNHLLEGVRSTATVARASLNRAGPVPDWWCGAS